MKDNEQPLQNFNGDCSKDPSCCTPSSGGPSTALKTGVFTIIVLLAIGVSAYSLFWRDSAAEIAGCGSAAGGCGSGCAISSGIPILDQRLIGADFGLAVITDNGSSEVTSTAVGAVAARIMTTNRRLRVINLSADDSISRAVIDKYRLSMFPAIVAFGGTSSAVFAGGEISEDALWRTFQQFGATAAVCAPVNGQGESGNR